MKSFRGVWTTCRINFQFHRYYASSASNLWYWQWALQLIKYAHTGPITDFRILVIPKAIFSCDQAALRTLISVCPSVCPSVRLSHLFNNVSVIISSWNFQELLPLTDTISMQKVKVTDVKGQGHRGHDPI